MPSKTKWVEFWRTVAPRKNRPNIVFKLSAYYVLGELIHSCSKGRFMNCAEKAKAIVIYKSVIQTCRNVHQSWMYLRFHATSQFYTIHDISYWSDLFCCTLQKLPEGNRWPWWTGGPRCWNCLSGFRWTSLPQFSSRKNLAGVAFDGSERGGTYQFHHMKLCDDHIITV